MENTMDDTILYLRLPYRSPKNLCITKLCLRLANLVSGAAVMGLIVWMYYGKVILPLAIQGAPIGLSLCWNFADALCIHIGRHGGIKPGAIVGCDLILWLGLAGTTPFTALARNGFYREYSVSDSFNGSHLKSSQRGPFNAALAFMVVTILLHFVSFVIGCRECDETRMMPKVAYIRLDAVQGPPGYTGRDVEMQPVMNQEDGTK